MTTILAGILDTATWEIIFATMFFFGLFFFILAILSSFGDEQADVDDSDIDGDIDADAHMDGEFVDLDHDGIPDGIDVDGDGSIDLEIESDFELSSDLESELGGNLIDLDNDGVPDALDLTGDGSPDVMLDSDLEIALDSDTHIHGDVDLDTTTDMDAHTDPFHHVEIHSFDAEKDDDDFLFFESKYVMGEYATFSMFTGMVGWFYATNLSDLAIILAIIVGYLMKKAFGYIIANYTQTVVVPIKSIRRGDIAQVRYSVTPHKPGLVSIPRRDGVISTEMAIGAFPHDNFDKGEKGYVWDRNEKGIYLITRGIVGQPDLNQSSEEQPKSKALDNKPRDSKAMDLK